MSSVARQRTATVKRPPLGRRLAAARASAGLTQQQLAHAAGFTQSAVSHVEIGRKRPSLDMLAALAVALGIDPHELDRRLAPVAPTRSEKRR